MFKKTLLFLILLGSLFSLPAHAFMEGVPSVDVGFHYIPAAISNGYGRDTSLTIASTDDIDVFWAYDDDTAWTEITEGNQTDTCPPSAGQACLTHWGNGAYVVEIDASLVTESGKMLCIDVRDVQASRTVGDQTLCKWVYPQDRLNDNESLGSTGKETDDIKDKIDRKLR